MDEPAKRPDLSPEQQNTTALIRQLLGKSLADRYVDFCRLASGAFPLRVSIPLAAHALRELESILRQTLAGPMEIGVGATLKPGPVGEYIEVVDVDPASGSCYAPVDLNHPHLLASDGLSPSEANPQFHQQMCYAVAMRTIAHFELALGRKAQWSSRYTRDGKGNVTAEEYVSRLRIYPHALRTANSFYSPEHKALLLGYFRAATAQVGTTLPGSRVFCAVSHDIIAHEITHALLDGQHRRYQEATNPDVLAFHEAFADIVALFQHFSIPEALIAKIRQTRGDLGKDNLLAQLAMQFGQATSGTHGSLRDALAKKPDRTDYEHSDEPHARGSVLVGLRRLP
jgi:hypothetical protein